MSNQDGSSLVPELRFPEFRCEILWEKEKLSNLVDLLSGYAFKSKYFSVTGKKMVTPKNFTKSGFANFNAENTKYTTEGFDERYICHEGDLLLLLTDLTSSCELLGQPLLLKKNDGEVLLNQRIVKVIPCQKIIPKFLQYFFLSNFFKKRIISTATGSTVRHSSNKIILSTELLLPSLYEQQKIADCLSSMDDLITVNTQKLESLKSHQKGLMQQLFPVEGKNVPELRFLNFIREVVDWEKEKLSNIVDLLSGYAFKSEYFSVAGQKMVTPKNFTKYGFACFSSGNTKYTTEAFDERYICREGDLLLLLTDLTPSCELLGRSILLKNIDGEVLLNQRIAKVLFKDDVSFKFLHYFFLSDVFRSRIISTATGSTVRHTSNKIILSTELLLPNLDEQQKIADCLSSIDELINAQSKKIKTLKEHKKGLMQRLFPVVEERVA